MVAVEPDPRDLIEKLLDEYTCRRCRAADPPDQIQHGGAPRPPSLRLPLVAILPLEVRR